MMSKEVKYITYEEVLNIYYKTITMSGGGFAGILDEGKIKCIIAFIQNDDYYPDFISKLNYLVFSFCAGHCFQDGNKRIALTIGAYFLNKNGHYWAACQFMKRLEAIIYHIAAGSIDQDLSKQIMKNIVECNDFDEELKIEILHAMSNNILFEEV
mgnify:CR=1 FL=1|jgi:death-on-curing protein